MGEFAEVYHDQKLLLLEKLVFAQPESVTAAITQPQTVWGADNAATFVLGSTYTVYGVVVLMGYVELKHAMRKEDFDAALSKCLGEDVEARIRKMTTTAFKRATATGLECILRERYEQEHFFMHGRLCPEVGRAFNEAIAAQKKLRCAAEERGQLVRALLRDIWGRMEERAEPKGE
jgi:hypothetical protein